MNRVEAAVGATMASVAGVNEALSAYITSVGKNTPKAVRLRRVEGHR